MAMVDGWRSCVLLCSLLLWCIVFVSSAPLPFPSLPSLAPAFVWSNHRWLDSDLRRISYQTLSSEDLAGTVSHEFVWTEESRDGVIPVDIVMAFIGKKLRSEDVSRQGGSETSDLLQVLKTAVTSSNSSVSLPYVMTASKEGLSLADTLLKSVVGDVDEAEESRLGEVMSAGACVYQSGGPKSLSSLDAVREYLARRKESKREGKTDLLIVCSSPELESLRSKSLSEGEILDEVLWGLDESKNRYVALYATDLSAEKVQLSRPRGRQLGSVVYEDEIYCDKACQTKAHLLEGLMVGLTLLIILISGLCCMAGIASPSRFEQAKDSQ